MRNTIPATISIDPAGARDLDDALFAERVDGGGWHLHALIPDVPSLVAVGSEVDESARRLGLTSYGAGGIRTPMLPLEVVDRLSLSPTEDRPVVHVVIAVGPTLDAHVVSIRTDRARTGAAMTYAQAGRALDDPAHPHHTEVATLWDLARRLAENRAAAVGADFDDTGTTWIDEEGRVVMAGTQRAHRANILVMEMMILVNAALAENARQAGVPVLYRNHVLDGFTRGSRRSAADELAWRERIGHHAAARRMRALSHLAKQAGIGTEPLGHHGLDLDCYAWFTSPLRRYADLASLRALVHGQADADLPTLARRLTELHRSQIESGDEHHGTASRKRLLPLVARGAHAELDGTDVHVIVRALTENPGFDRPAAMRHIARRMAADTLSGRDIAALLDNAAILGDDAAGVIAAWIGDGPRAILLAEHRDGAAPPTATKGDGINHKGALIEMAQARRARVEFSQPRRTGTPHAPIFTVVATWHHAGSTLEATGMDRTIRTAEQAAAREMLAKIPGEPPVPATPATPRTRAVTGAPGGMQTGVAPKTRLLEMAAATGAKVTFGEPRSSGPPHAPLFSVELTHVLSGNETRAYGEGGSKRDAERSASEDMIRRIEAR